MVTVPWDRCCPSPYRDSITKVTSVNLGWIVDERIATAGPAGERTYGLAFLTRLAPSDSPLPSRPVLFCSVLFVRICLLSALFIDGRPCQSMSSQSSTPGEIVGHAN